MLCKQIAFDIAELVYLITHCHQRFALFHHIVQIPDETDAKF